MNTDHAELCSSPDGTTQLVKTVPSLTAVEVDETLSDDG
jgi:hypothetical protein